MLGTQSWNFSKDAGTYNLDIHFQFKESTAICSEVELYLIIQDNRDNKVLTTLNLKLTLNEDLERLGYNNGLALL